MITDTYQAMLDLGNGWSFVKVIELDTDLSTEGALKCQAFIESLSQWKYSH